MKKAPPSVASTPTKAELEILRVLWELGPSTVRAIHERIGRSNAYTTVLKCLQIMHEKGLVAREEADRAHIYRALVTEKRATGEFIRDLVQRVFGGSSKQLVMQALGADKPSAEELAEIRSLIDELEKKRS